MTAEYTLHGRPLNVGDKVWSIVERDWRTVVEPDRVAHPNNVSIPHACIWPKEYAWDEPPAVDLASIPPPLCWIEGHPVRKGSAMMTKDGVAVVALGVENVGGLVHVSTNGRGIIAFNYTAQWNLTFALPPNSRPMRKVYRTFWVNKYTDRFGCIYESESEAARNADGDSQGTYPVTYGVEVPA